MKYLIVQLADETPTADFGDIADEMMDQIYNAGTYITLAHDMPKPIAVFETGVDIFTNVLQNAVFNTPIPE